MKNECRLFAVCFIFGTFYLNLNFYLSFLFKWTLPLILIFPILSKMIDKLKTSYGMEGIYYQAMKLFIRTNWLVKDFWTNRATSQLQLKTLDSIIFKKFLKINIWMKIDLMHNVYTCYIISTNLFWRNKIPTFYILCISI